MMYIQVMVVLISICSFAKGDPCAKRSDGCTTYITVPFSDTFRSSCNKHDICYACSYEYGLTRADCDDRFFDNMRDACKGSFFCKFWVHIYYISVRVLGSRYHHGNKEFCREPWVCSCMKR